MENVTQPQDATIGTAGAAFITLLRALPAEAVAFRAMSHTFMAHEMADLLERGDPDALYWLSDLLRISRDFIRRNNGRRSRPVPPEDFRVSELVRAAAGSRKTFVSLIGEVPGDTEVFRTRAKKLYSASELIGAIEAGHQDAEEWVTELLRVAGNFVVRQAPKSKT
jgi:hypothetical protein